VIHPDEQKERRGILQLEAFCLDVLAACDRGLPVTAEDVVAGIQFALKARWGVEDRIRYDQGLQHLLTRARLRQNDIDRVSSIMFGLPPK
jgi:hypothetical protein